MIFVNVPEVTEVACFVPSNYFRWCGIKGHPRFIQIENLTRFVKNIVFLQGLFQEVIIMAKNPQL